MTLLVSVAGCSGTAASVPQRLAATPSAPGRRALTSAPAAELPLAVWLGVYSSPAEIEGFTRTVVAVNEPLVDGGLLGYRMTFHSDRVGAGDIQEDEKSGYVLVEGDRMYLPRASGLKEKDGGRVRLSADVTRYTRAVIRGHTVLLRDDALKAYREQNRLYDYGVLIKVGDDADDFAELGAVKHESIRLLYDDASKGWKDPFVHGPNPR